MSRVFSKKLGGYIEDLYDFFGDKLDDINPYFKEKPTTKASLRELEEDTKVLGFDPTDPKNLDQYDLLRRKKVSGKEPPKEVVDPNVPSDAELDRMLAIEDGGPAANLLEYEFLDYIDYDDMHELNNNELRQIIADGSGEASANASDMLDERILEFNELNPIRDSDFEDAIVGETIGGVKVSELDPYYSTDLHFDADINMPYNDPDFDVDIDGTMRKYDIFGGTHNLNTKTNVGFDLPKYNAESDQVGKFGIGERLLSYYSPVENTISAINFPEKGLTIARVRDLLTESIPRLSKKMEFDLGGLRLKLNELQALDGNKLYSKKEIMKLYKEHGIYIEARILRSETPLSAEQRIPVKKLRLSSGRDFDPQIFGSYFEIDISATTDAGNRKLLNILQQTEEGVRPLSANFRYSRMDDNPMLQQGHFKPTNLAHARGSIIIGRNGEKQLLIEELQQDPQNILGRQRKIRKQLTPEERIKQDKPLLTAKLPSTEFISQLLQSILVHARNEGADEIVFPSALRIARERQGDITKVTEIDPKLLGIYDKGLAKYLDDLKIQSNNTIKIRKEVIEYGADKYMGVGVISKKLDADNPSTIINIKDFKFDPKRSKAKFSKGGLVQKRGLMQKEAVA